LGRYRAPDRRTDSRRCSREHGTQNRRPRSHRPQRRSWMRHRPQLTSPKLSDGNLLHAADFWTWSSGHDERDRLRDGVIWPELQKVRSWRSEPSLILAGALSTTTRPRWPRSLPVSGEPRPAPSCEFHRPYADLRARSHGAQAGSRAPLTPLSTTRQSPSARPANQLPPSTAEAPIPDTVRLAGVGWGFFVSVPAGGSLDTGDPADSGTLETGGDNGDRQLVELVVAKARGHEDEYIRHRIRSSFARRPSFSWRYCLVRPRDGRRPPTLNGAARIAGQPCRLPDRPIHV
jgi:hypothetical protein